MEKSGKPGKLRFRSEGLPDFLVSTAPLRKTLDGGDKNTSVNLALLETRCMRDCHRHHCTARELPFHTQKQLPAEKMWILNKVFDHYCVSDTVLGALYVLAHLIFLHSGAEAVISSIVEMKELGSIETKKRAQCKIASKWQCWDSQWGTHSLKSDFLIILVKSGTKEALERNVGT